MYPDGPRAGGAVLGPVVELLHTVTPSVMRTAATWKLDATTYTREEEREAYRAPCPTHVHARTPVEAANLYRPASEPATITHAPSGVTHGDDWTSPNVVYLHILPPLVFRAYTLKSRFPTAPVVPFNA